MTKQTDGLIHLFSGNSHPELGQRLAEELKRPLVRPEITSFADGETRVYLPVDVNGAAVCILQPTCSPVSENLFTLALLIDAARAAGAAKIVAMVPYFGYARQEQRGRIGESRSAQVAAKLLGNVGLDHLIVIDLHAPALESAFSFPTTMLHAEDVFLESIRSWNIERPVIVSPDSGGMKRAQSFAMKLGWPIAVVAKSRPSADIATPLCVLGDVRGHTCIIVDDMASTGRTLAGAAEVLTKAAAAGVHAVFTHAVMALGAIERIAASPIQRLITSDSVPFTGHPRLEIVSIAPMLAGALRRVCGIHDDYLKSH